MESFFLTIVGILAAGTPLVLATLGETITERAGVINLSLDGTILLAAMGGFAVAVVSGSPWLGLAAAAGVGAVMAAVLALVGLVLGGSQLAVGFILTLLARDLAYFLGHPFARQPGPQLPLWSFPGIERLPLVGDLLANQSPMVFVSLALIPLTWWWLFYTGSGLKLRAVGEDPYAAFARGLKVMPIRIGATILGGVLVGLAGGAYSLAIKPGWGRPQGAEGAGWIALAIVIFGGWHPLKAAAGAYLFATLQVVGIYLQEALPGLPATLFQVAPFPVMIVSLLLVNLGETPRLRDLGRRYRGVGLLLQRLRVSAPASLGREFDVEGGR